MRRVAVVGAGGMGSVVAGQLAVAGVDTVLVGRSPEHVAAIARDGLRLTDADGVENRIELAATNDAASVGRCDHVIVLTKSGDTAAAAETVAMLSDADTWVTSLQNGLGNVEALGERIDPRRVLAGTTTIGGTLEAPGHVSRSGLTAAGKSHSYIGPHAASDRDETLAAGEELAAVLAAAGLPTTATADVARWIWTKLALAVMGPVSAVLGATVAATWAAPSAQRLIQAMHDEVVAVAAAEGVTLDAATSWVTATATFAGTGEHYTSMATDLLAGRPTEIQAITGAVVSRARRHGVATPVSEAVVELIRAKETLVPRVR